MTRGLYLSFYFLLITFNQQRDLFSGNVIYRFTLFKPIFFLEIKPRSLPSSDTGELKLTDVFEKQRNRKKRCARTLSILPIMKRMLC